jgi:hypothetical protein
MKSMYRFPLWVRVLAVIPIMFIIRLCDISVFCLIIILTFVASLGFFLKWVT